MTNKVIIYKILNFLEEFYPHIDLKTEEDGPPSIEIHKNSENNLTIWVDIEDKIHITIKNKEKIYDEIINKNSRLYDLRIKCSLKKFLG